MKNSLDRNRPSSQEENWRRNVENLLGKNYIEKILSLENLDVEEFREFNQRIQNFISERAEDISSSRLRKIYELIKKAQDLSDLLLAIPYLAYMVGKEEKRNKKNALGELYVVLKDSIEKVGNDKKQLKNIQKFTEILVAYQKFYGKE
ncbi:MAG: type III-A CRISPR-associated protein Csm2 [Dictyoglomaceae bacterium]